MDKNTQLCSWGDCPGLDGGPKSRQHDGRFIGQEAIGQSALKNSTVLKKMDDSAENAAKTGDKSS